MPFPALSRTRSSECPGTHPWPTERERKRERGRAREGGREVMNERAKERSFIQTFIQKRAIIKSVHLASGQRSHPEALVVSMASLTHHISLNRSTLYERDGDDR